MMFWSLLLFVVSIVADRSQLDMGLAVRSLFPTVTALWWYPTAYAVFLLFFPFLAKGLHAIGCDMHRALCIVMIVLWTVLDMVMPLSGVGLPGGNWLSFVYIYVLVMYYRWYMQPMRTGMAWRMLVGGYAMIAIGSIGGGLLAERYGGSQMLQTLQVYFGKVEFRLPVLMVGLSLFVLFERHEFHNAVVNTVAGSTFGVYLISEYPTVRQWVWHNQLLDLHDIMSSPLAVPILIGVACAVFLVCTVLDRLRGMLFLVTVDRRRGAWFDVLWHRSSDCAQMNSGNA